MVPDTDIKESAKPLYETPSHGVFLCPRALVRQASVLYLVQTYKYRVLSYRCPEREVVRKYNEYKI